MTLLATGAQGEAINKLHQMVAASSSFQVRVNKPGQGEIETNEAGQHIYSPYLDDPDQVKRPFALIEQGTIEWYTLAGGRSNHMVPRGTLKLRLADNSEYDSDTESVVDFRNFVDGVLEDLAEVSGTDDRLNIVGMTESQAPAKTHPSNESAVGNAARGFWWCEYEIEWDAVG